MNKFVIGDRVRFVNVRFTFSDVYLKEGTVVSTTLFPYISVLWDYSRLRGLPTDDDLIKIDNGLDVMLMESFGS